MNSLLRSSYGTEKRFNYFFLQVAERILILQISALIRTINQEVLVLDSVLAVDGFDPFGQVKTHHHHLL